MCTLCIDSSVCLLIREHLVSFCFALVAVFNFAIPSVFRRLTISIILDAIPRRIANPICPWLFELQLSHRIPARLGAAGCNSLVMVDRSLPPFPLREIRLIDFRPMTESDRAREHDFYWKNRETRFRKNGHEAGITIK